MRLLLDTHALLWWVDDDSQLSTKARNLIGDAENDCHVSLVSAWEMAIKCATGKLKLAVSVRRYWQEHPPANDFQLLPIDLGHVTLVETLPPHHRDPFDRLLIAQAWQEGLTLVSSDAAFDAYVELDVTLVNDGVVIPVEVKTTLRVEDVRDFLERLRELTVFYPKYQGYAVYGAVAGVRIEERADRHAYRQGLFVLTLGHDGLVRILNDPAFRPRDLGAVAGDDRRSHNLPCARPGTGE